MKRLLFLSLLMIQGLWGAEAANGVQINKPRALQQIILLEIMLPMLTRLSSVLAQDPNAAMDELDVETLEILRAIYNTPERIFENVYVAWLNANPTQPIIVRQNVVQACQQMGIANVPAGWQELIVDVSSSLRHGITSLETRPGTIAYLVANNQMPVERYGELNLLNRHLAVCDAWNIPNKDSLESLDLSENQFTAIAAHTFDGFGSLQALFLNNNLIEAIPSNAFVGLDKLNTLNLSHNNIANFAAHAFAGLGVLKTLILSCNQLTTLLPGVFSGLNNLQKLHFYANPDLELVDSDRLDSIKEQHPGWFIQPEPVVPVDNPDDDPAVCPECNQIGDACTCAAESAYAIQ